MELKFIIFINKEFEEEQALVSVEEDGSLDIVLKGDYYHDKIEHQIKGFLHGITWTDESSYEIETKHINHKDEMFDKLDFNQEDYDDEE